MGTTQQKDRILRAAEAAAKIGLSVSSLYALVRGKKFPKPVTLTTRARGWRESEVDAWIEARP